MTEIWKTIANNETYSVSTFGRVNNNHTGKLLKGNKDSRGYVHFELSKNGERKRCLVHRLIAIAFIQNLESKSQVDHIDNNPSNNSLENLRWVSPSENNMNTRICSKNTSGIKGVMWDKRREKWCAQITFKGKQIKIGSFDTIEEAEIARRLRVSELFGVFANVCESTN